MTRLQASLPLFPSGGLHSNSSCCSRIPHHGNTGLGIGELDRAVCMLSSNEIAPSTASSYRTGVSHYMNFCSSYRLPSFLLSEPTFCCFVAFLVFSGLSDPSIRSYFSSLRHCQLFNGGTDPSLNTLFQLHYVLRGTWQSLPSHV